MWPGYFLETSFPSPCYPGEGLRWEVPPKDCSSGKLAVCSLAMSGSLCWQLEESARGLMSTPHPGRRSYSSPCTRSAWGSFFLLKSMCWLSPLCGLKPTPCPSHSGLCLRMLTLMTGSLSSLGSGIMAGFCTGEAPAGDKGRKGKRSGVSSPCLPCLGAVSLLKTESLVSDHGPLGQPILQGPSSHWLQ